MTQTLTSQPTQTATSQTNQIPWHEVDTDEQEYLDVVAKTRVETTPSR